jgi:hypothetical protein
MIETYVLDASCVESISRIELYSAELLEAVKIVVDY